MKTICLAQFWDLEECSKMEISKPPDIIDNRVEALSQQKILILSAKIIGLSRGNL